MRLMLILLAIGATVAGISMLASWLFRQKCPSCRTRTLVLDVRANPGGVEFGTGGKMYCCTVCSAEFRRLHNQGAFIPRGIWDTGARELIPQATALPPAVKKKTAK